MKWQQKVYYLIGQPIGVSFMNGQGTTGILCGISDGKLQIIEYLYQVQFALKQYDLYTIQDINEFPLCPNQQYLHHQRLY
ncbi:hypothetical protein [Sporosarcina obsidiansis]|uniref:hypothetical protein n=1 Tax=Sporosarcina obsidiansis TaxID=2660748 RepID=UPI00129B5480|nr:hypothetical protein [Sporosarcina obsidiansis]